MMKKKQLIWKLKLLWNVVKETILNWKWKQHRKNIEQNISKMFQFSYQFTYCCRMKTLFLVKKTMSNANVKYIRVDVAKGKWLWLRLSEHIFLNHAAAVTKKKLKWWYDLGTDNCIVIVWSNDRCLLSLSKELLRKVEQLSFQREEAKETKFCSRT